MYTWPLSQFPIFVLRFPRSKYIIYILLYARYVHVLLSFELITVEFTALRRLWNTHMSAVIGLLQYRRPLKSRNNLLVHRTYG